MACGTTKRCREMTRLRRILFDPPTGAHLVAFRNRPSNFKRMRFVIGEQFVVCRNYGSDEVFFGVWARHRCDEGGFAVRKLFDMQRLMFATPLTAEQSAVNRNLLEHAVANTNSRTRGGLAERQRLIELWWDAEKPCDVEK